MYVMIRFCFFFYTVSSPVVSGPAKVEEHVIVGRDASLCVEASEEGGSLSYQWQWKPAQEPTVGARGGGEGREGGDEEGKGEGNCCVRWHMIMQYIITLVSFL